MLYIGNKNIETKENLKENSGSSQKEENKENEPNLTIIKAKQLAAQLTCSSRKLIQIIKILRQIKTKTKIKIEDKQIEDKP